MDAPESSPLIGACVLERIAAGDPLAIGDCISRYGRLVWSLSRRFTRTAADAEDATQEIFLSLWTHAKAFDRAKGSETGFVATIARRRLIDRRRRSNLELEIDRSVDVAEAPDWADAGTACQVQSDAQKVAVLLGGLRAEWRQVLEMSLLDGLTQAEISVQLKMPLGTVKSFMRRGILQLRQLLDAAPDAHPIRARPLLGDRSRPSRRRLPRRPEFVPA